MKRNHFIALGTALVLLAGLYFLAPTVNPKRVAPEPVADQHEHEGPEALQIGAVETRISSTFTPAQKSRWEQAQKMLANKTSNDSLEAYRQLAGFYRDSVSNALLHFNYLADEASLVNTEKSLTFAAHSILAYLPYLQNDAEVDWLANKSNQLFDKALRINPENDSTIVGYGGTIMFGAGPPDQAMNGITRVRDVANRDSNFLFAQYMLGVGGMLSGQYDRAAERFEKVARLQPDNIEVKFKTAEAYEQGGKNQKAIEWYEDIARHVRQPELLQAVNQRLEELRKKN